MWWTASRGIAFGAGTVFATQGDTIFTIDENSGPLGTITDPDFHDLRGITYDGGVAYVTDQFEGSARILRVESSPVPEPAGLTLMAVGTFGASFVRRQSNSKAARSRCGEIIGRSRKAF